MTVHFSVLLLLVSGLSRNQALRLNLGAPWRVPGMGGDIVELQLPNLAHT